MSHKNILLVEGEADRAFFEALCQRWQLPVQVKVSTPRDAGYTKDTKQAAFAVLETVYLGQLADGHIERLAIAVDADSAADGGGFARTVAQLRDQTRLYGLASLAKAHQLDAAAAEHHDLIDALAAGDVPAAERLMAAHLAHVRGDWAAPR